MGFWKTERGFGGDAWADILDDALAQLGSYESGKGHKITMAELADLVEFCTRGHLVVEIRESADGLLPLSQLRDKATQTYSNRGQIHCEVA